MLCFLDVVYIVENLFFFFFKERMFFSEALTAWRHPCLLPTPFLPQVPRVEIPDPFKVQLHGHSRPASGRRPTAAAPKSWPLICWLCLQVRAAHSLHPAGPHLCLGLQGLPGLPTSTLPNPHPKACSQLSSQIGPVQPICSSLLPAPLTVKSQGP